MGYIAENLTCLADPLVSYHNPSISQAREARDPGTGSLASSSPADSSAEADGAPDGLAHEPRAPWRAAGVSCSLDAPAGLEASVIRLAPAIGTTVGLTNVELWL